MSVEEKQEPLLRVERLLQTTLRDSGSAATVQIDRALAEAILEAFSYAVEYPILEARHQRLARRVSEAKAYFERGGGRAEDRLRKSAKILGFVRAGKFGWAPVRDYARLVEVAGQVLLQKSCEIDLDSPPIVEAQKLVRGCPLAPWEAIKVLAGFNGFRSKEACLRWLQERRKELREFRATEALLDDPDAREKALLDDPAAKALLDDPDARDKALDDIIAKALPLEAMELAYDDAVIAALDKLPHRWGS